MGSIESIVDEYVNGLFDSPAPIAVTTGSTSDSSTPFAKPLTGWE
jgi:hypothetical protein